MTLFNSTCSGDNRFITAFETLAQAATTAANAYAKSVDQQRVVVSLNINTALAHSADLEYVVSKAVAAVNNTERPHDV